MLKEQQMSVWGEHPYHIVPSLTKSEPFSSTKAASALTATLTTSTSSSSPSSTALPRERQSFATTSLSLSSLPSAQHQSNSHSCHYPTHLTSSHVDCAVNTLNETDNSNTNNNHANGGSNNDNNKRDIAYACREHEKDGSEECETTIKEQRKLAKTASSDNCCSFPNQLTNYAEYSNHTELTESNNNNVGVSDIKVSYNNTTSINNINDNGKQRDYFEESNNQDENVITSKTNEHDENKSSCSKVSTNNTKTLAMTENTVSEVATRTATANTRSYISVPETQYTEEQEQREQLVQVAPELTYSHTSQMVNAESLRSPLSRPPAALSANIMTVYKNINLKFCNERRRQMPRGHGGSGAHGKEIHNNGYDDEDGHYIPIIGEEIASRYTVQEVIGKGSFGVVLKCCDEKYQEGVAMKIVRTGSYFESQGVLEAEIVAYLNRNPALQNRVVQLRKAFIWQSHIVLVFELLSFNLFQLIRCTKYNGVSLDLTRKFAYQLLQVLLQLEKHRPPIIHCDLKPENVVLRDPSRSGIRLIDFGSACYQQMREWEPPPPPPLLYHQLHKNHYVTSNSSPNTFLQSNDIESHLMYNAEMENSAQLHYYHRHNMPKYIQSRFYRAPEVILELGYTTAIDRWSLGCMLVELHTGVPLFPGKNEAEMLARFAAICGPIPQFMLERSPKVHRFYDKVFASAVDLPPPPPPFHLSSSSSTSTPTSTVVKTTTSSSPLIPSPTSMVQSNSHHSHKYSTKANEVDSYSNNSSKSNHYSNANRGSNHEEHDVGGGSTNKSIIDKYNNMAMEQSKMQTENDESASHLLNTQSSNIDDFTSNNNNVCYANYTLMQSERHTLTMCNDNDNERQCTDRKSNAINIEQGVLLPPQQQQEEQSQEHQHRQQHQYVKNESNMLKEEYNINNKVALSNSENHHSHSYVYALKDPPSSSMFTSLRDIIGVYDGGPRGCRRGQHGHDVNSYLIFLDFISNLLQYDPRLRMDCATALRHPFFQPILEIEARETNAVRAKREENV